MRVLTLLLEGDAEARYWAGAESTIAFVSASAVAAAVLVANALSYGANAEPLGLLVLGAMAGLRVMPSGWPLRAALKAFALVAVLAHGESPSWPEGHPLLLLVLDLLDATTVPFRYLLPLQLLEAAVFLRASFTFLRRLTYLPWLCQTTYEAMSTIAGFSTYGHLDQCSTQYALQRTALAVHLFLVLVVPALLCYCTERAAKLAFMEAEVQPRQGAGRPAGMFITQLLAALAIGICLSDTASDLIIWAWPQAVGLDRLKV